MLTLFRASPAVTERSEVLRTGANRPVHVELRTDPPERVQTGVLAVGAFADGTLPLTSQRIDKVSNKKISTVLRNGDLEPKAGSTLLLHDLPGVTADRVLLVSLGPREQYGDKAFRDAINGAARRLADGAATSAVVTLTDIDLPGRPLA